jgi:hypothetical protein
MAVMLLFIVAALTTGVSTAHAYTIETAPPGLETSLPTAPPVPTIAPVVTPAAVVPSVPVYSPSVVNAGAVAATLLISLLISLAIALFFIVCFWRVFVKAGEPGWASIIPIYNTYILLKITGKPWWWLLLFFIPLLNLILLIIVNVELAQRFGKSSGFAVGLIFLPFIFFPILAFGSAQYQPQSAPAV